MYGVNLNEESTEIVQVWLKANGQTFSGWLTVLIDEFAKEIQGQPSVVGTKPEDMSLKEFLGLMRYWYKRAGQA